ncbi:hypothetical protein TrRE_jg4391, partial [Triparma retinervis]
WRSSTGDGPVDQAKAVFEIDGEMLDLLEILYTPEGEQRILCENADGTDEMYYTIPVPFPLSTRECVLRRSREVSSDRCYLMTRSSTSLLARSVRRNPLRVKANVHIGGYLLEALGPNRTRVTYVVGVDLNGVFALDWVGRNVAPHHLKEVVTYMREISRKEERKDHAERVVLSVGESFADGGDGDEEDGESFEMVNVSIGKLKDAERGESTNSSVQGKAVPHRLKASINGNIKYVKELKGEEEEEEGVKGALDMGSIFGGGGDEEEGAFEMTTNVKARTVPVEKVTSPLHDNVG